MDEPRLYSILRLRTKEQFWALVISILLLVGAFIADISTPRAFGAAIFPYFIGLLITARIPYRRGPFWFAAVASVLSIAGYFLTTGFVEWIVISNRVFLVISCWIVAYLVFKIARLDELKTAQHELARSHDQLQLVIDSLPAMILYLDTEKRYRYADKTFSDWFALPREEVIGQRLEDVFPSHYPRLKDRVERVLQGETVSVEETVTHPDGVTRPIRSNYVPHFGPEGEVIGFFTLVEDVSEQKKSEDQLRQAQRMEAVGQLTGGVAHDFNNLLAILMGNLELAMMRLPASNDLKPLLESAVKAAERGAALTAHLLAFSRRQSLAPAPTDINALTERVLDLARRTLGEAVQIDFRPQDNLWQAKIDAARLENALLNLALNARDAMPDGGTISVRTYDLHHAEDADEIWVALDDGDYVVIEVADTGIGMSKEVAEKAFEPFFTTKEVGQGSGLGLSMVYGFVKQSGGHTDIRSVPGKGTTVRLFLPRSGVNAGVELEDRGLDVVAEDTGETVLIVEDDPDVRQSTVSIVESLGYETLEFDSAEAALGSLEDGVNVDLVLSDVVLGRGMNGVVLANQVREKFPCTKVLLMSGYAAETVAQDGEAGDAHELLLKPFKITDLRDKISDLLR